MFEPELHYLGAQLLLGGNYRYENWGTPRCQSDFSRLYLMRGGAGVVRGDDFTLELRPGFLYLLPDHRRFEMSSASFIELHWVHFRLEFFQGISVFRFFSPPMELPRTAEMTAKFDALLDRTTRSNPGDLVRGYALLLELLADFLPKQMSAVMPPAPELLRFRPVIEFLIAHPEWKFDLKQLGKRMHMHPTYFSNRFSAVMKLSPLQFHIEQRMRRAYRMLHSSTQSIGRIAGECGYADEVFFAKSVKKYFGVTPRQLRGKAAAQLP